MWGDLHWCKQLYNKGYLDSQKNRYDIISKINPSQCPLNDFCQQLLNENKNVQHGQAKKKN